MAEWIPFEEGRYRVERAVLLGAGGLGVELEDAVIEVAGPAGRRRLRGWGRVANERLVRLLDLSDELDLVLDLGGEFKYRLRAPRIQGGKVFAPGVKSFIQITPAAPWEELPEEDFTALMTQVRTAGGEAD
jgi:hypothetical protein